MLRLLCPPFICFQSRDDDIAALAYAVSKPNRGAYGGVRTLTKFNLNFELQLLSACVVLDLFKLHIIVIIVLYNGGNVSGKNIAKKQFLLRTILSSLRLSTSNESISS